MLLKWTWDFQSNFKNAKSYGSDRIVILNISIVKNTREPNRPTPDQQLVYLHMRKLSWRALYARMQCTTRRGQNMLDGVGYNWRLFDLIHNIYKYILQTRHPSSILGSLNLFYWEIFRFRLDRHIDHHNDIISYIYERENQNGVKGERHQGTTGRQW